MLNAAIVSLDSKSGDHLQAYLQQSMLVDSVHRWTPSPKVYPTAGEPAPDVVLLDLSGDVQAYLEFSAHAHRLFPAAHIIAVSQAQPSPDFLLRAMRAGVRDFLPKPLDFAALKDALLGLSRHESNKDLKAPGKLLVVMGTKGGVGTSTVAVNLAVQVRRITEKKVILIDFARPLGDDCLLLDLKPRFSIRDATENLDRLDAHLFEGLLTSHKCGLEVLAGALHPDDWQVLTAGSLARVISVARRHYDFVIVDFGSVYSSEWKPVLGGRRGVACG